MKAPRPTSQSLIVDLATRFWGFLGFPQRPNAEVENCDFFATRNWADAEPTRNRLLQYAEHKAAVSSRTIKPMCALATPRPTNCSSGPRTYCLL
jgi:hypothetical protein